MKATIIWAVAILLCAIFAALFRRPKNKVVKHAQIKIASSIQICDEIAQRRERNALRRAKRRMYGPIRIV